MWEKKFNGNLSQHIYLCMRMTFLATRSILGSVVFRNVNQNVSFTATQVNVAESGCFYGQSFWSMTVMAEQQFEQIS